MAYKITDECIACGTCASECPVEAITEGDGIFVIDADACIECKRLLAYRKQALFVLTLLYDPSA